MSTIKVSEATGPALDWLVAKCLYVDEYDSKRVFLHCTGYEGARHYVRIANQETCEVHLSFEWHPSTDWSQGGPIIEREHISTVSQGDAHEWTASVWDYTAEDWKLYTRGATPLIAAMRCFVASRFGETAEVPDALGA